MRRRIEDGSHGHGFGGNFNRSSQQSRIPSGGGKPQLFERDWKFLNAVPQ